MINVFFQNFFIVAFQVTACSVEKIRAPNPRVSILPHFRGERVNKDNGDQFIWKNSNEISPAYSLQLWINAHYVLYYFAKNIVGT